MKKLTEGIQEKQKSSSLDKTIDEQFYQHDIQQDTLKCINQYMFHNNNYPQQYSIIAPQIVNELSKKISSYKMQDKVKQRLTKENQNEIITIQELIEKLHDSNLQCHYCEENVFLIYKMSRELSQWTLDRLNNDLCHTQSNVVISCLQCNLNKKRKDEKAYKFTKQLNIVKKDSDCDNKNNHFEQDSSDELSNFNPEEICSNIEYSQDT